MDRCGEVALRFDGSEEWKLNNAAYMINMLMDLIEDENVEFERVNIDDGGASLETTIHYNIDCPYYEGDKRALCHKNRLSMSREMCVECKTKWLLSEVDE